MHSCDGVVRVLSDWNEGVLIWTDGSYLVFNEDGTST